ncbi:nose resistant to fluoxetine protein 6-like [Macrobrachium nipponense]|uniref:nose resistant to fluoxetine protein 6-like n=1 Tax=Macrobrachium nipponense TaxID=159736 RepID=UPI0030C7A325
MISGTTTFLCVPLLLLLLTSLDASSGYVIEDDPHSPYNHGEPFFQNVHPRGLPDPLEDVADGRRLHPALSLNKHSEIHDGVPEGGSGTGANEGAPKSRQGASPLTRFSFPDRGLQRAAAAASVSILEGHWARMKSKIETQDAEGPPNTDLWDLLLFVMRSDLYLPSTDRTLVQSEQCVRDVETIYKPDTEEQWSTAFRIVDSWGKMPDGLLWGNIQAAGAFDECLSIRGNSSSSNTSSTSDDVLSSFKGKYCSISLKDSVNSGNVTTAVRMPGLQASGFPSLYTMYGTCMPSSCVQEDLLISLNEALSKSNKSVAQLYCQTDDPPPLHFTPGLVVMICLLSLFGLLLLAGAALDCWIDFSGKKEMRQGPLKYLLAFSLTTNLQKMFHINTAGSQEAITCLYGMRVLSMAWVVWCHQYMMVIFVEGNLGSITNIFNGHWLSQIMMNGYPSVDSFFFMSGLLVAYGILRERKHTGKVNLLVFYVHRYIRLAVPILLLCGFLATFTEYLAHGPNALWLKGSFSLQEACQNYWWRDALFITNFFVARSTPTSCLGVCWYTAVDFQIFLFTPLILFPFLWEECFRVTKRKLNIVGLVWLGVVVCISVLVPGIITGIDELPPTGIMSLSDMDMSYKYNKEVYMASWCRAQPYLVGMGLGILFRRDGKKKVKLEMWQVVLGWLIATATGLAVIFGMYDYNQIGKYPGYNWADSVFYASLHRLAWGLALAWVVFACHYGYGGVVNSFLSHPSWQPLSRLTYCMFLVAIPVQTIIYVYNDFYPLYFSHLNKVLETVGALFVSGVGAVLLSLCTEAPVMGLEKLLLRRDKEKR